MTKRNKNKILSGLVAFSFLFSNIVPVSTSVVYAADENTVNKETADKQEENKNANMTDQDKAIQEKVNGQVNANGKVGGTVVETRLQALAKQKNAEVLERQQTNQTSQTQRRSYFVYDEANNQSIIVTENLCYNKFTPECSVVQTFTKTNTDGTQDNFQYPLNQFQYLSGTTYLTNDMLAQIRNQQINVDSYNDPNRKTDIYKESLRQVYQANNKVSGDIDSSALMWQQMMSRAAMAANEANIARYRKYNEALDTIAQAKQDVTDQNVEKEQIKRDVISQDSTKRFTAKISPAIPLTGKGHAITLMLKTKSGKPNDTSQYFIKMSFINTNTGKQETLDVLENTEYILEEETWDKKPGVRNVTVYYHFKGKGNGEQEKYLVSYNVGNMATSILPDGRNVKNGVTALVSNAQTMDYLNLDNSVGVAGRILDVAYQDGTCLVQITDAQKDSDVGKYQAVNIATQVADESECTRDLIGKYANFQTVSAKKLADGSYVFMDTSNPGGTNLGWDENAYNKYEDEIAKDTQNDNINGADGTVLKVDENGIIHEGLAGKLNTDYVCFKTNGACVSIVRQEDGSAKIAKVDGSEYTQAELISKGIPPLSSMQAGFDQNGVAYVSDMTTGKSLTMKSFSEVDKVSPASRKLYALSTLGTPNLDKAMSSDGYINVNNRTETTTGKVKTIASNLISTVTTSIGNMAMVADATSSITAPLSKVNLKQSPMSSVFKSSISNNPKTLEAYKYIRQVQKQMGYTPEDNDFDIDANYE